jgi:hypothetical protein
MAMAMDFTVNEIGYAPSDTSPGYVQWEYPTYLTESSRTCVVFVFLSGIAAEHIYCQKKGLPEPNNSENYQTDLRQVSLHLQELQTPKSIDDYHSIAVDFLQYPSVWDCVESFAILLMRESKINKQNWPKEAAEKVPRFFDVYNLLLRSAAHFPSNNFITPLSLR